MYHIFSGNHLMHDEHLAVTLVHVHVHLHVVNYLYIHTCTLTNIHEECTERIVTHAPLSISTRYDPGDVDRTLLLTTTHHIEPKSFCSL